MQKDNLTLYKMQQKMLALGRKSEAVNESFWVHENTVDRDSDAVFCIELD